MYGIDYSIYLIAAAVSLGVYVLVWLIFRRPTLWYFRINEMIALQERTVAALERMAGVKEPEKHIDPVRKYPDWTCRKCGATNPWDADKCDLCHTDRGAY
jgi:hypothetical protein